MEGTERRKGIVSDVQEGRHYDMQSRHFQEAGGDFVQRSRRHKSLRQTTRWYITQWHPGARGAS